MTTELDVRRLASAAALLSKWAEAAAFARGIFGERYPAALQGARKALAARRAATGEDDIHAAMALLQGADAAGHPAVAALFAAALVEEG